MITWLHITLLVACAVILVLLFLLIFRSKTRKDADSERAQNLQNGIARLHQVCPHHHHRLDTNLFKKTNPPLFNWADHPSLVADAVENGWSRFAFTTFMSSPSLKSPRSLLGACAAGDQRNGIISVEIGWEVIEGPSDYMQKVRLNPGLKKIITAVNSSMGALSLIRTALPLPGPRFGNSLFPQEAYFEITILPGNGEKHDLDDDKENIKGRSSESERIKLIDEDFNEKINPDSLTRVASSQKRNKIYEVKQGSENEGILLSVGLTGEPPLAVKFPGTFPGSVGFNSTGSVYLDGTKLVSGSEKNEWGRAEKVIGCGYSPAEKKVYFTVDSQLVHEIHCKTQEFSSPLYPTLAANTDVTVLVNLGQSPFKFAPGNLQRSPNPGLIRPDQANSPEAIGYEDSKELLSIGSQRLRRSATTRSNNNTVSSIKSIDIDQESESDLFEIILDSTGPSPYSYTTTHQ